MKIIDKIYYYYMHKKFDKYIKSILNIVDTIQDIEIRNFKITSPSNFEIKIGNANIDFYCYDDWSNFSVNIDNKSIKLYNKKIVFIIYKELRKVYKELKSMYKEYIKNEEKIIENKLLNK